MLPHRAGKGRPGRGREQRKKKRVERKTIERVAGGKERGTRVQKPTQTRASGEGKCRKTDSPRQHLDQGGDQTKTNKAVKRKVDPVQLYVETRKRRGNNCSYSTKKAAPSQKKWGARDKKRKPEQWGSVGLPEGPTREPTRSQKQLRARPKKREQNARRTKRAGSQQEPKRGKMGKTGTWGGKRTSAGEPLGNKGRRGKLPSEQKKGGRPRPACKQSGWGGEGLGCLERGLRGGSRTAVRSQHRVQVEKSTIKARQR